MPLNFSGAERETIMTALDAVLNDTAAFEHWEFSTLFGIERPRFELFVRGWEAALRVGQPGLGWPESPTEAADLLRSVVGNLLGYPHRSERSPPRDALEALERTLQATNGGS
jgi:hypothetical protein